MKTFVVSATLSHVELFRGYRALLKWCVRWQEFCDVESRLVNKQVNDICRPALVGPEKYKKRGVFYLSSVEVTNMRPTNGLTKSTPKITHNIDSQNRTFFKLFLYRCAEMKGLIINNYLLKKKQI